MNLSFSEQQGIIVVGSPMYHEKYAHFGDKDQRCKRILLQLGMFFLTYFNYSVLHATRSAWSITASDLELNYGFENGTISDMNATFLFFYALGGIFLG
jgi:sugar phosphate permease